MRVAVVSGSNKGIGFAIVRALCKKFDGDVFLTSRDETRGKDAIAALEKEGLHPKFHPLNISDEASIVAIRDFMKATYGGIDVLVNNAAIAIDEDIDNIHVEELNRDVATYGEHAKVTLDTNYWDNKNVCDILFPILKDGARVVNVSSSAGFLGHIGVHSGDKVKGEEIRKTLSSPDLTVETLDNLMKNFVETASNGTHRENGWPNVAYFVSKVGWSALSRIQQRMMDSDPREDIVVNHMHPGFVDTDMTRHQGPLTIDRGAECPVFCALLPPKTEIRGAYLWHDCSILDWVNGPLPAPA